MKKVILCSQNNLLSLHFHPRLKQLSQKPLGLQVEIKTRGERQSFYVSYAKLNPCLDQDDTAKL